MRAPSGRIRHLERERRLEPEVDPHRLLGPDRATAAGERPRQARPLLAGRVRRSRDGVRPKAHRRRVPNQGRRRGRIPEANRDGYQHRHGRLDSRPRHTAAGRASDDRLIQCPLARRRAWNKLACATCCSTGAPGARSLLAGDRPRPVVVSLANLVVQRRELVERDRIVEVPSGQTCLNKRRSGSPRANRLTPWPARWPRRTQGLWCPDRWTARCRESRWPSV